MFAVLLLALFSTVAGDVYECLSQKITLDNIGYSLHSVQMAPDRECILTFTWPDDYIATVQVEAQLDYLEDIFVSSDWGQTIQKAEKNSMTSTSAWPPNSVNVTIRTIKDSQMILTLIVQRQPFSVQDSISKTLKTVPNMQPFYIDTESWMPKTAIVVQSDTQVAVTRAEPQTTDDRNWANVFVYEGTGADRTFRGTIYSLTTIDAKLMSQSKGFTLYFAIPSFNLNGTVVVNDKQNVDFLTYVQTAWSPYDQAGNNFDQKYLLDATEGTAALTVLSKPDGSGPIYVTKIDYLSDDATHVDLLAGGCVKDPVAAGTKLAEYTESTFNLPQFVPGRARTFVLSKGSATVSYTVISSHANYDEAVVGRTGLIMTNNYPFWSDNQDSPVLQLKSGNGGLFTLALIFNTLDTNKDSYINITLTEKPGVTEDPIIISLHDLPVPCVKAFNATDLSLTIHGGKDTSTGISFVYGILSPGAATPDPNKGITDSSSNYTTTTPTPTTSYASTYGSLLASFAVFLLIINI